MEVIEQEVIHEQLILSSDIYSFIWFFIFPLIMRKKIADGVKKMFLFLFVPSF